MERKHGPRLLGAGQAQRALPYIKDLAARHKGAKGFSGRNPVVQNCNWSDQGRPGLCQRTDHEHPTEARWWKGLAHVQLNAGRNKEALASLTIYSWLTPLNDEERRLLADLNMQTGIPALAAPLYEEALNASPKSGC
jgi:hypothetical protein